MKKRQLQSLEIERASLEVERALSTSKFENSRAPPPRPDIPKIEYSQNFW
jgi:hypothetical protein